MIGQGIPLTFRSADYCHPLEFVYLVDEMVEQVMLRASGEINGGWTEISVAAW